MHQIDELAQDIRTADGNHDLAAGVLAEKLIDQGWVKLPTTHEEMGDFLVHGVEPAVEPRVQALVNYAIATDRLKRKPLREGDYVEVLKDGNWVPGKVNSTGAGGIVNVDTERGPVTAYQGKSRIRPAN